MKLMMKVLMFLIDILLGIGIGYICFMATNDNVSIWSFVFGVFISCNLPLVFEKREVGGWLENDGLRWATGITFIVIWLISLLCLYYWL